MNRILQLYKRRLNACRIRSQLWCILDTACWDPCLSVGEFSVLCDYVAELVLDGHIVDDPLPDLSAGGVLSHD